MQPAGAGEGDARNPVRNRDQCGGSERKAEHSANEEEKKTKKQRNRAGERARTKGSHPEPAISAQFLCCASPGRAAASDRRTDRGLGGDPGLGADPWQALAGLAVPVPRRVCYTVVSSFVRPVALAGLGNRAVLVHVAFSSAAFVPVKKTHHRRCRAWAGSAPGVQESRDPAGCCPEPVHVPPSRQSGQSLPGDWYSSGPRPKTPITSPDHAACFPLQPPPVTRRFGGRGDPNEPEPSQEGCLSPGWSPDGVFCRDETAPRLPSRPRAG
jgi:hypothetical protein